MWGAAHPCAILDAVDVELHGDVKAVEEIPPKHQRVLWGVHSMDPPCNKQDTRRCSCVVLKCAFDFRGLYTAPVFSLPDGIMKVFPCLSSILWQSKHLSPKKMSPCFPDKTQFSYISRFWGVGGISQNTCRVPGKKVTWIVLGQHLHKDTARALVRISICVTEITCNIEWNKMKMLNTTRLGLFSINILRRVSGKWLFS